jgi:hypothetical protein
MKNSILNKGITILMLFILAATSSAGCFCVESDCCFVSMQSGCFESIEDNGPEDCDCGCTADQCVTTIQNSIVHLNHGTIQSVLRVLTLQPLTSLFYPQLIPIESVLRHFDPSSLFSSAINSFLYSSKTVSLQI